jgi:catalase
MTDDKKSLTTGFGAPVDDDQNTTTAGTPGPSLLQDVHLSRSRPDSQRRWAILSR